MRFYICCITALSILFVACKQEPDIPSVKIGENTWMVKNLDVSRFRNGDSIPEAKTKLEWAAYGMSKKAAWSHYNNDIGEGANYGKLYNWYAVNDPRGLAPEGWHSDSCCNSVRYICELA